MRVTAGIAIAAVAVCQMCSSADAAEKFERKYVENTKEVVEVEEKVDQTLTIAGMPLESKVLTFIEAASQTGQRDGDGNLAIDQGVTSLRANLDLPGGLRLDFDSANPDKKADNPLLEPVLDIFRAIIKTPSTTVVDRDGKAQEVKFDQAAIEQLSQALRPYFTPERQKKEHEQFWGFLPDKEVEMGAEWERFSEQNLGDGQIINFRTKFSYAGTEARNGKTYHKFNMEHQEANYSIDPNANAPFQVSKSELKVAQSSGYTLYDPATGEIPYRESSVKMTGTMTVVINGMELPSEIDLTITSKATLKK